jgi:hypothetical protein
MAVVDGRGVPGSWWMARGAAAKRVLVQHHGVVTGERTVRTVVAAVTIICSPGVESPRSHRSMGRLSRRRRHREITSEPEVQASANNSASESDMGAAVTSRWRRPS